ncbi:CPBP family intramembrane glutamic endopeptidase [Leptospira andrefontaineae]|uniref:CPBP family intramembrane metalloprotease n=1 Tax=Leptospira andrefontaineae TaxID=2484976 RepID=A0A4R9H4C8_9LEPT|nr:CPBP family intramembrane glutamic endopeptidase [Leptospira andrefontaineae]TGK39738.1 CPBP family intramembrane metalloprotease [Leptospira andrefontaineae]
MDLSQLSPLIHYFLRVTPALVFAGIFWFVIKPEPKLRILIYILLFVLFRDAMTGAGLWSIGSEGGFWIRLSKSSLILVTLGATSIVLVFILWKFDIENRRWVLWFRGNQVFGVLLGLLSSVAIALPVWILNRSLSGGGIPGGEVDVSLLLPMLWFSLAGNLYEEFLFRGYIRGIAEEKFGWLRASFISGISFAFFHIFLASTVTSIGFPLLVFTLWEGCICGFLASRYGLLSSAIAHGFGIWILASGVI